MPKDENRRERSPQTGLDRRARSVRHIAGRELARARQERNTLLKLVNGYGSIGVGGDIRIAVQKRLLEMAQSGQIRGCIFGENWSKSDDAAWKLLQSQPALKNDSDLGRRNRGVTIVLL